MSVELNNIGAFIKPAYSDNVANTTSNDGSVITGDAIDRNGFTSGQFVITWGGSVAQGETLETSVQISDCDTSDGSYNAVVWLACNELIATGLVCTGAWALNIDLSGYERYIKIGVQMDFSASSVDTATACYTLMLGGADSLPADPDILNV